MANTVVISRSHLIYGLCLPLAVLIGYMLAEPLESGSVAVVVMVLTVLCIPAAMRWHFPLLVFSCNAAMAFYFLPGRPPLWILTTALSTFFLLLNRAMGQKLDFFRARQVSHSLFFFGAVVLGTAYLTGGIGFGSLGNNTGGGRRYAYIYLSIALYFALSTISIPRRYARLATAAFFLSSLTGLMGYVAMAGGPAFNFLVEFFPIEGTMNEMSSMTPDFTSNGMVRLASLTQASTGLFCFLMAWYGARGVLDLTKPWRLILLSAAGVAATYSGFRSSIIMAALIFAAMFYLEGLFRTRYFLLLSLLAILGGAVALPFAQKLPLSVQRSLCFLPINVDPIVQANAEDSTDWRIQMWQEVLPTVPKYLIKGKGFAVDQADLDLVIRNKFSRDYDGAMASGDYHSGPLSLIIPLGIFGVIGFVWFLVASMKVLRSNYRYGDPELKTINMFLMAFFAVRIFFYFFIFGSLYSDLFFFTSLIGLSVSLNHGVCQPSKAITADTEIAEEEL